MPFTPSHAVVALAFVRSPLSPAAIAIGAMAPDLPLFVRGTPVHYGVTHSFAGLPVTVLVAWALLLLWRGVLRPATGELSPEWLASRLPAGWDDGAGPGIRESFSSRASRRPSVAGAAIVAASLAIGVLSHLLWDPFTHQGRWGTAVIPALTEQWGPLYGYSWLQHGSSALGLIGLAVFGCLWLRRRTPHRPARVLPSWVRWVWWLSLPLTLVVTALVGLLTLGPLTAEFTPAHLAYRVLPPACACWALATILLAIAIQLRRARSA